MKYDQVHLGDLMVVGPSILQQGLFQFRHALEAGGLDDLGDTPIESPACALNTDRFHHAVVLGSSGGMRRRST